MKNTIVDLRTPIFAKIDDGCFFREHPGRKMRIRRPYIGEYLKEFQQFGLHDDSRRRIIVARIPKGQAKRHNIDFMRIPFLAFADETIEDTDEIIRPILNKIMRDAASGYGMKLE